MSSATHPPLTRCCECCAYFVPHEKGTGSCHRFPPVFAGDRLSNEHHHWRFPLVHRHAWCGEFQARASGEGPGCA
ncbi:MAG: hypothetical protein N3C63_11500 [Rhodocyclaceae bacterium]|nr:hypothetical protein [Rhodocyclaceae bacterium]